MRHWIYAGVLVSSIGFSASAGERILVSSGTFVCTSKAARINALIQNNINVPNCGMTKAQFDMQIELEGTVRINNVAFTLATYSVIKIDTSGVPTRLNFYGVTNIAPLATSI